MPALRVPRKNLSHSVYLLDIITVGILLLISHLHVDEARPPNEHNTLSTRWEVARGPDTRRLSANNNNNPAVLRTNNDANFEGNNPSMILPLNKQQNANQANGEDSPISINNNGGEISGDGSLEDTETDDDNEEGDEDDYDDETGDGMDSGSGSHESKDVLQVTPPQRFPNRPTTSDKKDEKQLQSETITTTNIDSTLLNSTIIGTNIPSLTNELTLPVTTFVPSVTTEIPTTTTTSFSLSAPPSMSTTLLPKTPIKEDSILSTARPWSFDKANVTKLPSSSIFDTDGSKFSGNSSYDYEDEDGEDEDEDDNDNSSSNFEDNIPSEAETHFNASMDSDSASTTETYPTLETASTQTIADVTTMTDFDTTSTTTSKPITTTTMAIPSNIDRNSNTTISTAPDDYESSDDRDGDEEDDTDDDDENEDYDDIDDLEDIDSDISELASTSTPDIPNKQSSKYSDSVNDKNNESLTTTKMVPTTNRPSSPKFDIFITQGPSVIINSRVDEPNSVPEIHPSLVWSMQKNFEVRSIPFFAQPIFLFLVLGCTVTGLFVAILIVMFIVYKLRRQEEI